MDKKYHVVAVNLRTGGRYQLTDEPVGYDEARAVAGRFGKSMLLGIKNSAIFDIVIEAVE